MEKYEKPVMEVESFCTESVILTSGEPAACSTDGGFVVPICGSNEGGCAIVLP